MQKGRGIGKRHIITIAGDHASGQGMLNLVGMQFQILLKCI